MDVQIKQPSSLTSLELDLWRQLQASRQEFSSPYFHPQFTLDVASVRADVEVAVIKEKGRTTGFFPFQRRGDVGLPVGGMLSDAHGVLLPNDVDWSWTELLKSSDLKSWNFHYLIGSQSYEHDWTRKIVPGAILNVAGGFEEYSKRVVSKSVIGQTKDRARKLARALGEIRTEWASTDEAAMNLLRSWKSQQYRNSDITDVFSFPWINALLNRIWSHANQEFQGILSVVKAGERIVSLHFGIRSRDVLHMWFPVYDTSLKKYSPGMIHILELARHAPDNGINRIDMGRVTHYKSRVATDYVDTAEGAVELRPFAKLLNAGYDRTFEWLRHSPLRSLAKIPGRMLRIRKEQHLFQ